MLYSLKGTANNHKWHVNSFQIQFFILLLKLFQLLISSDSLSDRFITLHSLTLTSFKTRDVKLKLGRFLKVGVWVRKGHVSLYRSLNTNSA